jgi:hypothetical protein
VSISTPVGITGPSCSSAGGGPLPPSATTPALWRAAAPQRLAIPAVGVAVWHDGGPRPALYPMPVRGDLPPDTQPGRRNHARSMHAGVRTDRGEDGRLIALPPGPDAAVGVPATWQAADCGNDPAANTACRHRVGAGNRRRGGPQARSRDEIYLAKPSVFSPLTIGSTTLSISAVIKFPPPSIELRRPTASLCGRRSPASFQRHGCQHAATLSSLLRSRPNKLTVPPDICGARNNSSG